MVRAQQPPPREMGADRTRRIDEMGGVDGVIAKQQQEFLRLVAQGSAFVRLTKERTGRSLIPDQPRRLSVEGARVRMRKLAAIARRAARDRSWALEQLTPNERVTYRSGEQIVRMRSRWEVDFARLLDALELNWLYEPHLFRLPDGAKYTPDFFVQTPMGFCFVELHVMAGVGLFAKSAEKRRRAQAFILRESGAPLVILDEKAMLVVQRRLRRNG